MDHVLTSTVPVCPTNRRAWDTGVVPGPGDRVYLPPGTILVLGRVPWGDGIEISGPGEIYVLYIGGGADCPLTWAELIAFVQILCLLQGLAIYLPMLWVLMGRLLRVYGVTWYGNADYTTSQTGAWDAVATWGGGGFPVAGDTATVQNTHVVTVQGPESCATLTVDVGGTVTLDGQSNSTPAILTIESGGSTIANSGTINSTGTGSTGYAEIKGISLEAWTGTAPSLGSGYWRFNMIDFQMNVTTGAGGCTVDLQGNTTWDALTVSSGDTLLGNSHTMTLSGNLNMASGTFTYGTSTISMTGAGTSLTSGSSAWNLYNLTISNTVSLEGRHTQLVDGGTFTCSSTFTLNQHFSLWDGNITTINNTGTVTTGGTRFLSFLLTGGTDRNISTALGTITVNILRFVIDVTGGNTVITMQGAYTCGTDIQIGGKSPNTLTLNTANYALNCVDLTCGPSTGYGCVSPGSSTITVSGDWNFSYSNAAWNTSTETLVMSGSNKTITTSATSDDIYSLTINDDTNVSSSVGLYLQNGGTLTIASGKTLAFTDSNCYLYDSQVASLSNSGIITTLASKEFGFVCKATTSQTTGTLGDLTGANVAFWGETTLSSTATITLGSAITCVDLLVNNLDTGESLTLSTSGTNYAVNCTDLTLSNNGGGGSGLTANGSTITCAGNVDMTNGTFTQGTSNLTMSGTTKVLTMGTNSKTIASLTVTGTITTAGGQSFTIQNAWNVGAAASFTVASGDNVSYNNYGTWTYNATGSITAADTTPTLTLKVTSSKSLPSGNGNFGNLNLTFDHIGGGAVTYTLGNNLTCKNISITDAAQDSIVDTNSGSDFSIDCVDLTVSTNGTLTANNSTLTCSGDVNLSAGTFTYGTSNLTMTGNGTTLTAGSNSYQFYSVTFSESITWAGESSEVRGGAMNVGGGKTLTIDCGSGVAVGDNSINTFANSGTIQKNTAEILIFTYWASTSKTLSNTLGTMNIDVHFRIETTAGGSLTTTLGSNLTLSAGYDVTVRNINGSHSITLDTDSGNDFSIGCTDFTLTDSGGGGCGITGNGSTITCAGDVNLQAGTFTYGTSNLTMTASKTLTTGSNSATFYDLTINDDIVFTGSTVIGIVNDGTLTIASGKTLSSTGNSIIIYDNAVNNLANSGTISIGTPASRALIFYLSATTSQTTGTLGTLTGTTVVFDVPTSQNTADGTYTLGSAIDCGWILIRTLDGTYSSTLDTSGTNYAVNCTDLSLSNSGGGGCGLTGNGSTITCSGDVDLSAGTFTYGTSTLTMTGASKTITTGTSSDTFYNLILSATPIYISGDSVLATNGTVTPGSNTLSTNGDIDLSAGTFTYSTSNLTLTKTGGVITTGTNSAQFYNMTISGNTDLAGNQSNYIVNGGTLTVSSSKFFHFNAGNKLYLVDSAINNLSNSGTLNSKASSAYLYFYLDSTAAQTTGSIGSLSTYTYFQTSASVPDNGVITLGSNLSITYDITSISSQHGSRTCTVDTDSGNNRSIGCINLTLGTRGAITANNSTINCSGNVNLSSGTFTYGTSNLTMTGTTKVLTPGASSNNFYSLTINGNTTITAQSSSLKDGGTLTIANGKTFTVNASLAVEQGQIANLSNSGTIAGSSNLVFNNWNADYTLGTHGTITISNTYFRLTSDENTSNRTITLGGSFTTTGNIQIDSTDGTYECLVDLSGSNMTSAALTIGTRGTLQSTQAAGSNTITTSGNLTITGSVDLSTVTGTGTIEIDCSGTLSGAGTLTSTGQTLTLNNMTFSLTAGQFTHSSGTVVTGSTSDMTITTEQTWNNVQVGASPGITSYQADQTFVGAVAVKNGDTLRIDATNNDVTLSWDGSASATLDIESGGTFDIINNTVNTAKIQSNDTTAFAFTNSGTVTWVESGGGGNQNVELSYVDLQFTLTTGGAGADTMDLVLSGSSSFDDLTISSVDTFVIDCTSAAVTMTLAGGSTITNNNSFSFTGLSSTKIATITSDDTTKVIWSGTQPTLANPASTEYVQFGTSASLVGIDFHTNTVDLDVSGTFQPDGTCHFENINVKDNAIMKADSSDIDHQVYGTLSIESTGTVDLTNSTDYYVRGLNNFGVIITGAGFIIQVGSVSSPPQNGPINPAIPQAVTPVQWRDALGHHRGGMDKGSGKKRRKRTPSR